MKNAKTNIIYALWNTYLKPENCEVVGICRSCNNKMKKNKMNRVEQFLKGEC